METGEACLLRHVAVDDCGTVINPLLAEGQERPGGHPHQGQQDSRQRDVDLPHRLEALSPPCEITGDGEDQVESHYSTKTHTSPEAGGAVQLEEHRGDDQQERAKRGEHQHRVLGEEVAEGEWRWGWLGGLGGRDGRGRSGRRGSNCGGGHRRGLWLRMCCWAREQVRPLVQR